MPTYLVLSLDSSAPFYASPFLSVAPSVSLRPEAAIAVISEHKKITIMEILHQTLRILHIAAGTTAFFVAPVALVARKGGKAHASWGKVFFWGMVLVAASAVPMTIMNPNPFLFLIAIFSFHLSLSGYRAVVRRRAANPALAVKIDLTIPTVMILFYLALASWGLHLFTVQPHHPFGYISLVFATIGLHASANDLYGLVKPSTDRMAWWYDHMQGMITSYIAAVSAFSAVNFFFLPDALRWLWPTLIGAPLLGYWKRYYRKKFNQRVSGPA
jgi:uncharacterized membrane protein